MALKIYSLDQQTKGMPLLGDLETTMSITSHNMSRHFRYTEQGTTVIPA